MAIDYTLHWECEPRRHFGEGNCPAGAMAILEMLKSRNRAQVLREQARQAGQDPDTAQVVVRILGPDGNVEDREVSIGELEAQALPLSEREGDCGQCPVSLTGEPFGCFGCINYPISTADESWLIGRLQPFGTVGNELCRTFLQGTGVSGDHVHGLRKRGLFESPKSQEISRRKGLFGKETITSDQLLQSIFYLNNTLDAKLCCGFLVWFGALALDGSVPSDANDVERLKELMGLADFEEKKRRVTFALDAPSNTTQAAELIRCLKAMHLAWLHGIPLLVDA